ncbi:MAG TPA: SIMPL domain-containing protein [Methanocorpusculum sp.]|nr:SIMPL domain-containing protein [Methanocorpusculum sp.]HJJ39754.1 SIMPL domain-containing protein [Methanocorpusculum sp.]HJJ49363.1 SIMPL domain-containing protein [Methanocorpusculum sp.]HJJ56593.1 SIMPL domain-containing protein [Methanocorpusculum sp.]
MKRTHFIAAAIAVLAVLVVLIAPVAADNNLTDHIIEVSGYGESTTTPDKATISLGIETVDKIAFKAQEENSRIMNKVISALKAAGIKEENIKTNQYSMYSYEIYDYNKIEGFNIGDTVYSVTNTVEVITYDVDSVGSVIDKAIAAGANKVNRLQFGLSNEKQKEQRNAAIYSAVKAARADADAVAAALGIRVTGTGVISVSQSYNAVSYSNVTMDSMAMKAASPSPVAPAEVGGGTQISSGTLSTTATVSIVFTY